MFSFFGNVVNTFGFEIVLILHHFFKALSGHSLQADKKFWPSSLESVLGKCPTIRLACCSGKITIHSGSTIRVTLAAARKQIDLDVLARMN